MKITKENIYYQCWKQTGLKRFEFANRLGISQNGLSNYFHEMAIPSVPVAKKIIHILKEFGCHYTLDDLYRDVPTYEPSEDFKPKVHISKRYVTPKKLQINEEKRRKERMEKNGEVKTRLEMQIEFEEKRRMKAGLNQG